MKFYKETLQEESEEVKKLFNKENQKVDTIINNICSQCKNKPNKDEKCMCKKIYDMFLGKE